MTRKEQKDCFNCGRVREAGMPCPYYVNCYPTFHKVYDKPSEIEKHWIEKK
jgi:hypothetical protein